MPTKLQSTTTNLTTYLESVLKDSLDDKNKDKVLSLWNNKKSKSTLEKILKQFEKTTQTKKKDPNAPKKARSSYIWYCADVRESVKAKNPEMKTPDLSREMGKMWKSLTAKQKKKYEKKAQEDRERYENEMKSYEPPENYPAKKKSKKKDGPKRPLTSYMLFCQEKRVQLKQDNPEMKSTEIVKEMGRAWRGLEDDEKKLFVDKAQKNLDAYNKEHGKESKRKKTTTKKKVEVDSDSEEEEEDDDTVETGFLSFCTQTRPLLEKKHSKWNKARVTKELTKLWNKLPEEEQTKFETPAVEVEKPKKPKKTGNRRGKRAV